MAETWGYGQQALPAHPLLEAQRIGRTGLKPSYVAAQPTFSFWNTGRDILHIKNGSGASITATVPYRPGAEESADRVYTVGAGGEIFAGPFPARDFNPSPEFIPPDAILHPAAGYFAWARVVFSATASVTVALLDVGLDARREI
jgi:hypothetical protein